MLAVFAITFRPCWTIFMGGFTTPAAALSWYTSREIVNWRRTCFSRKPEIRVLERGHRSTTVGIRFAFWLYAVARNLTIDYFRKRTTRLAWMV